MDYWDDESSVSMTTESPARSTLEDIYDETPKDKSSHEDRLHDVSDDTKGDSSDSDSTDSDSTDSDSDPSSSLSSRESCQQFGGKGAGGKGAISQITKGIGESYLLKKARRELKKARRGLGNIGNKVKDSKLAQGLGKAHSTLGKGMDAIGKGVRATKEFASKAGSKMEKAAEYGRETRDELGDLAKSNRATRSIWNFYAWIISKVKDVITDTGKLGRALLVIGILAIVCLILWILIYHMQPRLTWFCHDENPFEQNMVALFKYVAEFDDAGPFEWDHLLFHYMFAEYIDYMNSTDNLGLADLTYIDLWGNEQKTFPIADTHAWGGFVRWDKNYVATMLGTYGMTGVQEAIIDPGTGEPDDNMLIGYIRGVQYKISLQRQKLAAAAAQIASAAGGSPANGAMISTMKANTILNVYTDKLVFDFNMRRPPSFNNVAQQAAAGQKMAVNSPRFIFQLTLMKVYLSELAHYIFVDQIKNTIWPFYAKFVKSFTTAINEMYVTVSSGIFDLLKKMIAAPPASLVEQMTTEPPPPPIVEHMSGLQSFFDAFLIIPQFIEFLMAMAQNIDSFFSNPLGYLLWIVFVVLLIVLYIVWTVVGGIYDAALVYPTAVLGALAVCVAWTAVWLLLFAVVLVIFAVFIIIDWLTVGYVCLLLRCENTPDSWIYRGGFQYDNIFTQNIVCSRPCPAGFKPTGGFFCQAVPQGEPTYCPHQYIYSAYSSANPAGNPASTEATTYVAPVKTTDANLQTLPNRKEYIAPQSYSYVPDASYHQADDATRLRMIQDFRDLYVTNYFDSCVQAYKPYDAMTLAICVDVFNNGAGSAVGSINPGDVDAVREICYELYCEFSKSNANFCGQAAPSTPPKEAAPSYGSDAPLMSKIVVAGFTAIAVVVVLSSVYFRYAHRRLGGGSVP